MSRRGGHRPLNQMNGDYLSQLKKPLRSEMNRHVIGTNKAVVSLMNKKLDLYYKDKNIALEKVRRRQEAVYNTMLRVHKEKKILQRAAYKRRQEEGWQTFNRSTRRKPDILRVEESKKDVKEPDREKAEANSQENNKAGSGGTSSEDQAPKEDDYPTRDARHPPRPYVQKAKVLEVTKKKNALVPITRERSDLGTELVTDNKLTNGSIGSDLTTFADIRKQLLPDIRSSPSQAPSNQERSTTDIVIESVAKAQDAIEKLASSPKSEGRGALSQRYSPTPLRPNKGAEVLPTITETDRKRHLAVTSRSADQACSKNDDSARSPGQAASAIPAAFERLAGGANETGSSSDENCPPEDGKTTKKVISLAERNRRRAMARLRRRHEVLQSEQLNVYIRDANGNYVLANTEFKRREFAPPSNKEKHFQKKMLRAQMAARLEQQRKLEAFFQRIAEEEREKQRIREAFKRQAMEEREAMRRKLEEESQKLGFSPSQLVTLFSKGIIPEGIDPSSFEAIRYCKYIRLHLPNSSPIAEDQALEDEKTTSWSTAKLPS